MEDHLQYVARLNLEDPVASTSKDSEPPVASTSKDLDTTIVPPSVINPYSSKKILCSVATTRPELSNNSGLSVLLKCSTVDSCSVVIKGKRKHQDDDKTEAEPWMETLCENLSSCLPGIEFESKVMTYLIGVKFLTPGSSAGKSPCSFFQFEEAVFKLAGIPDCSDGVFVYTVFEIQFTDEKQYYIKYFESGEYTGFMEQVCIHDIINYFQTKPESVFLSSIGTQFDITQSLMNRQETVNEAKRITPTNRFRPAKLFNNNSKLAIENLEKCLKKSDETNAGLKGVFFHCASKDFKTKTVSLDGDQKDFQVKQMRMDYQFFNIQRSKLISFPLEKIVESDTSSSDFVKSVLPTETSKCLLKQSIALNSLSCATKKQITGKAGKGQRFETRFPHKNACSFRNKLFFYFMEHDSVSLKTYFKKCISASSETLFDDDTPREYPKRPNKRRKVSDCVKTVTVTPDMIQKQTDFNPDFGLDSLSDSSLSIYDGFVRRLVAEKSIFIQIYRENETVKAVMNDYNCDDGRFKESAFVITSWNVTETGGYLTCSCRIYRTLLDLSKSTGSVTALDVQGATCMHCRFFKEIVLPNLNTKENENLSGKEHLIQNSLKYNNETIIEISSQRKTKKFSVIDSDALSFVNLTYNKRLDRYIASCEDGYCKSKKGSKKCVENLMKGKHCPHLEILKCNPHFWNDFASSEDNVEIDNEYEIEQNQVLRQEIDDVDEIQEDEVKVDCTYNFDPETGLWTFPCKSKHIPRNQNDIELQKNVRIRDNWNYMNLSKTDEGYLKGENLIPNIPVDNCSCKVGWHDEDRPEGIIKRSRTLVIYTSNAPVKCDVYNRFCLSSTCSQPWDEGKNLCIHVLSNETAAGDEIGWEYINSVLSGSITFSSFCRKKSKDYKMRNKFSHNFMDPSTFIKWWFSWASSLKIDFRKPCPVCQFEPKQLACDGTKVGIGFRHANFTDISKPDNENLIEPTIHRRLDRCFLSNDLSPLTNRNMNECRSHLNYLSKKALNELTDSEILTEEIEQEKNAVLVSILPAQVGHSFHRFLNEMLPKEKNAYASVMKMLSTTAPISSFLPSAFVGRLNRLINHMSHVEEHPDGNTFVNSALTNMRTYAPEIRLLIACSLECSANGELPVDIISFLQYLIGQSSELSTNTAEPADLQPGTYNPAKYGRAYYFSQSGEKLRNARKFSIDTKKSDNNPYDDPPADFDKCDKYFSKTSVSAKGTSNLFLWFCPIHGHCYGFHLTNAEGRKDPAASLYTHLKQPPQDIFYDFACNLQEYCLNRESDFYKDVRFFHDIFHGFSHKCSTAYRSSRLHGFECINSEICEQFNSFIQCIKPSGRQMSQEHFCFYLQFFLNIWNEEKYEKFQQRLHVAQAGLLPHS